MFMLGFTPGYFLTRPEISSFLGVAFQRLTFEKISFKVPLETSL